MTKISEDVFSAEKELADATAAQVYATHNRKMVLSHVMNGVEAKANASGEKSSEAKLDRLARDSSEYAAAVNEEAKQTKRVLDATALRNKLLRDYEIARASNTCSCK